MTSDAPDPGGPASPPVLASPPLAKPEPVEGILTGRLHPLSLVVSTVRALWNLLLPALAILFTGQQATLGMVLLAFLAWGLVQSAIRYFTFRYRVEGGELITRGGILERQERHIPLERVQDLRVEQGPLLRLFGVVDLHVETAGGTGPEATLSVLSRAAAETLRRAVFEQAARRTVDTLETPVVLQRLTLRDLVVEGLTANRATSALVVLGAGWQFLDDLMPKAWWAKLSSFASVHTDLFLREDGGVQWAAVGLIAGIVVAASALFSVAGAVVLFHGFTLGRRGEDLFRSYGLLTRRASSLPRRRIQLLKMEESWLRRRLGLAVLRADTAGRRPGEQGPQEHGHDVLLPLVRRDHVDGLLPEVFPDFDAQTPAWEGVSRCAVRRATVKALAVCGIVSGVLELGQRGWVGLVPLLLVPLIYGVNVRLHRHWAFARTGRFFLTRRGWWTRTTHLVPIRNVQGVTLRQTPFDRRYGVWSLAVDTAGQAFTGGAPRVANVPAAAAWAAARGLAQAAVQTRYRR